MSRTLGPRLRKLEAERGTGRQIVIHGRSEKEFTAKIAAARNRGEATDWDQFVCTRLFSEERPR